jgi:hypothetical protein
MAEVHGNRTHRIENIYQLNHILMLRRFCEVKVKLKSDYYLLLPAEMFA